LVILENKGHWREIWDLSNSGDTRKWDDDQGSGDSSSLGVGKNAPEAGVLCFWGLATPSKEYCEPSLLTF